MVGDGRCAHALELDLPALPESSSRARHAVTGALEGTPVDLAAVRLAVTEAVTNAVVHAYRHCGETEAPGRIRVALNLKEDAACVIVADDGLGMAPNPSSPGLGLGLSLIASMCDELEIDERGSGTRVRMRFALAEEARPASER
jgi:anti-sigma regulatory factor (Ser/Thr protein kinase)